jgi:hypothetical protein
MESNLIQVELFKFKYDPEAYQLFFNSLTAGKCLFSCRPSKESGIRPTAVEKWMGTEYLVRKIDEDKLKKWSAAEPDAEVEFCPEEYQSMKMRISLI